VSGLGPNHAHARGVDQAALRVGQAIAAVNGVGNSQGRGPVLGVERDIIDDGEDRVGHGADQHAEMQSGGNVAEPPEMQPGAKVAEQIGAGDPGDNRTTGEETNNLTPHPTAEIFPMMATADFDALVAGIEQNGQLEPIVTYQGMILDGRHRYRACQQLGRKPNTTEWDGNGSPESFVISKNLWRRHLTVSQRAITAAKIASFRRGGDRRSDQAEKFPLDRSQKKVAEMLNISDRSVRFADTVVTDGVPELVQAVERGEIALADAATITELPKARQTEIATAGRSAKRLAKQAARRIKRNKAAERERQAQSDDQGHHHDRHVKPDLQPSTEAGIMAGDLELDRDQLGNNGAELDAPTATQKHLRQQIHVRDQFIASLLEKGRVQHRLLNVWRQRALAMGWKESS